jgi:hypothetical protein
MVRRHLVALAAKVGSIPAVRIAAINSRSATSDLPLLRESVNGDYSPPLPSGDSRQNSGRTIVLWLSEQIVCRGRKNVTPR